MICQNERVKIMETSTKNWLTKEQIKSVIQKYFKSSEITNIQRFKEGTLNTIYLIEGTHSLREGVILKTAPSVDTDMPNLEKGGLYTEIYVYQLLKDQNIPVPQMYAYDFSRKDIPCDYLLLERVKGKSWSKHLFDFKFIRKSTPRLMKQLGKINAVLHGVEGDWFGYIKDNGCHRYDLWSDAFTAMVNDLLEEAKQRGYNLPYNEIRVAVNTRRDLLDEIRIPKLVNFDMWTGNIYLAKNKSRLNISGIIDFERFFFGDPLATFPSFMLTDLEKETDFISGYSEVIGKPFKLRDEDRSRLVLYSIYASLIEVICTYRYNILVGALYRYYLNLEIKNFLKILSSSPMKSKYFKANKENISL